MQSLNSATDTLNTVTKDFLGVSDWLIYSMRKGYGLKFSFRERMVLKWEPQIDFII